MKQPVYLLDFSVYRPPDEYRVDVDVAKQNSRENWTMYDQDNADFLMKVAEKSGLRLGGTYLPPAVNPSLAAEPKTDIKTAMLEAELVMGGAVSDVLAKTGVRPDQVDILITNCSIFCPTPSLASMLINKFKFRQDVQAYHLGGMGCAVGVVAIGLVRDMLQAHPNAVCLYVPAEITSYCFYPGKDRDKQVANAIFRMGGAAALFTNRRALRARAKYALEHSVRVHTGQTDAAYGCISWGPDDEGLNGVHLGKDVPAQAVRMLEAVFKAITPRIMTWRQYAEAAGVIFEKKVLKRPVPRYVPDYTRCVDHFALHAGGYAVLKGMMKGLGLPIEALLPSFASLRDYGNTSSSTTWYTIAYLESQALVKRGEAIMQVGAGGGMKGAVNIWRALRDTATVHPAWAHCAGKPYVDADLPRRINEPPRAQHAQPLDAAAAAKAKARAAGGGGGDDDDVAAARDQLQPGTPPRASSDGAPGDGGAAPAFPAPPMARTCMAQVRAELDAESRELGVAAL